MERRLASERVRQRREGTGGHGLLMHEGMRWRGLDPTCRGGKHASPALGNPRNPQHRQPPPGLSSRLQPLAFSPATLHHAGQPEKESEWKRDKESEKGKKKGGKQNERERGRSISYCYPLTYRGHLRVVFTSSPTLMHFRVFSQQLIL